MRATGIVRKVDQLGRLVLPKETRTLLNIEEKITDLEIFIDGDRLILKKHDNQIHCNFCDNKYNLTTFKDRKICLTCLKEIGTIANNECED